METPISKAIRIAGGKSSLARQIGTYPQLIDKWERRGGLVPTKSSMYCPLIEALTGVSKEELCPDIPWSATDSTKAA